jgi:hypothetical protein
MPLDIPGTISTININGHNYTHADWEANTPAVIGGLGQDISDQIAALETVGILTKAITTSVTLSGPESTNLGFVFTGSLSGTATITFAAGFVGIAQIENQTTGGFGLLCGLAAGTKVSVPASGSCAAFCDGTNFGLQSGNVRTSTGAQVVGSLRITNDLVVDDDTQITGDLNVDGAFTATTTGHITGNVTVGGAMTVTGAQTTGAITGTSANFSSNQTVSGAQTVTGAASFGGNITAVGNGALGGGLTLTATGGNDATLDVKGASGKNSDLRFFAGTSLRWAVFKDSTTEAGADSGSNFIIACYDDTGTVIGTPIVIERSTGHIMFGLLPTSSAGLVSGTLWSNGGVLTLA